MKLPQLLCVFLAGMALLHDASGDRRGCATTAVNIRTGPSTRYRKVGVLQRGICLPYKGLSGSWAMVIYGGQTRYVHKAYLTFRTTSTSSGCPTIITRAEWRAKSPRRATRMRSIPRNVYVHHATGPSCSTTSVCKSRVRGYQNYHMNTRGWSDIGYSFLIGEDGNVYEGRGWMVVGGHTKGHNSDGYGICFIGDFTNRSPNSAAQTAFRKLIKCGIDKGYLRSNYVLKGHRDVGSTACPGRTFYNLIKTWPHYMNSRG